MKFKNLVDLAKAVQTSIKDYFGLAVELEINRELTKPRSFDKPEAVQNKKLCEELGITLHGVGFLLRTPTNIPIERLELAWDFDLPGGDYPRRWSEFIQHNHGTMPVMTPETELRNVTAKVFGVSSDHSHVDFDLPEMRLNIRQRWRGELPDVKFLLVNDRE